MIKTVKGNLLTDIEDYSVILHQCNAKGWMGAGLAAQIAKRWPKAYEEYYKYCRWFKDGHEEEILGTFVSTKINDKLIICNAIGQVTVGKTRQQTDYDAWEKLCRKIEKQTKYINEKFKLNWTIHAPDRIGCGLGGGDYDQMHEIFEYHFKDSPVGLVFHEY